MSKEIGCLDRLQSNLRSVGGGAKLSLVSRTMVIEWSSFLLYTATTTNVDLTTVAEATTASTADGDITVTDGQTQTCMYCNDYSYTAGAKC